ncbi:hypothetical protein ACFDR9_001812 [Janthinobacterium sp. CG_23.3]|uniref:hypothetical protein n=1 Tax=unclassified Janthinobacterium TaxID=2610881 RepID=UPI00034B181F|nr:MULTISPECIES: hypothetical protein [unclassified Janthinobacterium]MEC5159540.1 hypothetical protein [Janthinobacterium sp. CG_S6]
MTVFAMSVFDATIVQDGNELFKGRGSATQWAERVAAELKIEVTVEKLGNGWVLRGRVDGVDCVWAVYGQRIKRLD